MIKISTENLGSVEEIKETLIPLLQNDDYNFQWLSNVLASGLDTWVLTYLNSYPPVTNAFYILDINEHMTEATDLINSCTSIRNEIFSLENQALSAALEYVQIINSIDSERLLGNLNVLALFKQSGEGNIKIYQDALENKLKNIELNVKAKFSLHNQPGNSLNYGERVGYLKEIYGDNIKNIYERVIAIKRTLKYSFNQYTDPIPNYIELSNSLNSLVKWMRNTIYAFETISQHDYVITKTITLAANLNAKGENLEERFKSLADLGFVNLDISAEDFGLKEELSKARILGMSFNIIGCRDVIDENGTNAIKQAITSAKKANNEMKRELQLFYCEVVPPRQNIVLDKDNIFSLTKEHEENEEELIKKLQKSPTDLLAVPKPKLGDLVIEKKYQFPGGFKFHFEPKADSEAIDFPRKLIFGDLQPIYKSSINTNQGFLSENSIKNASPIGRWEIHIKNVTSPRIERDLTRLDDPVWGILDIALTFRLAVRENKPSI